MLRIFDQYRGLRRELYILFWGRVVTNMGALIWPMMTLILTGKLGYTSGEASSLMLLVGVFMLPCTMIGGKLADRLNKKNLIVVCDLVTVTGFLICGILPLRRSSVVILAISQIFAQMEWPSYDALVANLSTPEQREKAYSLNYLGGNLGIVLSPILGGLLFENHLDLAFLISGFATLSSTVLIFFFVKDISCSKSLSPEGSYENDREGATRKILSDSPVLLLFILSVGIMGGIYNVAAGFVLPLGMQENFGARGALLLGTITSTNALIVVAGTPVMTGIFRKMRDVVKFHLGIFLQVAGIAVFAVAGPYLPLYYVGMIIFTLGEVLLSLSQQPYLTRRVPASHRGRISSVVSVSRMLIQGMLLPLSGHAADVLPLWMIWCGIVILGGCNVLMIFRLRHDDKKQFSLLYQTE